MSGETPATAPEPITFVTNPFSPEKTAALYKTMADAQATIPEGHSHAILLDTTYTTADGLGGMFSYVQKEPDGWNIVINTGYDKPHGISAGVLVGKSW